MEAWHEHDGMVIVEGVAGCWHYHIAPADRTAQAYCGAVTMSTHVAWNSWGYKPKHIPHSYCKECGEKHAQVQKVSR